MPKRSNKFYTVLSQTFNQNSFYKDGKGYCKYLFMNKDNAFEKAYNLTMEEFKKHKYKEELKKIDDYELKNVFAFDPNYYNRVQYMAEVEYGKKVYITKVYKDDIYIGYAYISVDKETIIINTVEELELVPSYSLSGGESKLITTFQELQIKYVKQFIFPNTRFRYDFNIEYNGMNILVEFDGRQHFVWTRYFHKEKTQFIEQKERDYQKCLLASEHGHPLLHISYNINITSEKIVELLNDVIKSKKKFIFEPESDYEELKIRLTNEKKPCKDIVNEILLKALKASEEINKFKRHFGLESIEINQALLTQFHDKQAVYMNRTHICVAERKNDQNLIAHNILRLVGFKGWDDESEKQIDFKNVFEELKLDRWVNDMKDGFKKKIAKTKPGLMMQFNKILDRIFGIKLKLVDHHSKDRYKITKNISFKEIDDIKIYDVVKSIIKNVYISTLISEYM